MVRVRVRVRERVRVRVSVGVRIRVRAACFWALPDNKSIAPDRSILRDTAISLSPTI